MDVSKLPYASFFPFIDKCILTVANQTHVSDIPDGRLLQAASSRLSEDDISAEYEHSAIDPES